MAKTIDDLIKGLKQAALDAADNSAKEAAEEIRLKMVQRVSRGVGVNSRKFVPYAPSTAKRKGRRDPVNLYQTGRMLGGIRVRKAKRFKYEVRIPDKRQEQKARWQQFGTRRRSGPPGSPKLPHIPPRAWFGVTVKNRRETFQIFNTRMRTAVKKDRRTRLRVTLEI